MTGVAPPRRRRSAIVCALAMVALLLAGATASPAIGASGPITSAASSVALDAVPVKQTDPAIAGTATSGETLTADPGTWSGAPTGYAYRWQQCGSGVPSCQDIAGATGQTYDVRSADVGNTLRVGVVASNAGGDSAPAFTAETGTVAGRAPVNITAPDLAGDLTAGKVLTADPGTWTDEPFDYHYQWYGCDKDFIDCPNIAGATGQTFLLRAADIGRLVGVEVVAINAIGTSDPSVSGVRGPIVQGLPTILSPPALSGIPQLGETLSATEGTWTGAPTSFAFQWYSCDAAVTSCAAIGGATGRDYAVAAADVGRRLNATVVAANATGSSVEEPSAATPVVRGLVPGLLTAATITGRAQQGATVAIKPATWSQNPTSEAQQWTRCNAAGGACAAIVGATAPTYVVVAADVGSRLQALVSAANAFGGSEVVATEPTPVVLTALDITFTRISTRVRSDGAIALTLRTKNPGTVSGSATASSRSLAARTCTRRCPKARQIPYGTGMARLAKPGTVTITIRPNARARTAVAKYRRIFVRVKLTFRSSVGVGTNTKAYFVIVKKKSPTRVR